MADAIHTADRVEAILNRGEPRIARAFLTAIRELEDELDLARIEQLLLVGDFETALTYIQTVAEQTAHAAGVTFIDAGQDAAKFLSGLDLGTILFDPVNEGAVAAIRANTLRLIREFNEEQRRATTMALVDGIARGLNPVDAARNFRDSIGLTERQQAAVINYRRLLQGDAAERQEALTRRLRDKRFDRTVARDTPLTPQQIDRMVERYRARYIQHRAIVIGRTEALRSANQGTHEAFRQAIESGRINAEDLDRTWDSSRDGRVRPTHVALHGQTRDWDETWQTPNGVLRYPGDPEAPGEETIMCRCIVTTRIKNAVKEQQRQRREARAGLG